MKHQLDVYDQKRISITFKRHNTILISIIHSATSTMANILNTCPNFLFFKTTASKELTKISGGEKEWFLNNFRSPEEILFFMHE
jgi:hypothetical protein